MTLAYGGLKQPVAASFPRTLSGEAICPSATGTFRSIPRDSRLTPSIRAGVHFLQGSILDPRLLDGDPPYDVVFCRNLLIYLDRSSRVRVMATLDRLLASDGRLVIGHADRVNLSGSAPVFGPIDELRAFTYHRVNALPPAQFHAALPSPSPCVLKNNRYSSDHLSNPTTVSCPPAQSAKQRLGILLAPDCRGIASLKRGRTRPDQAVYWNKLWTWPILGDTARPSLLASSTCKPWDQVQRPIT